ncbi:bZIP transcription factor 49 [Raphanus sativus]|nr:bZIP transcription factor 49 [Raphanus sativus]
MSENATLKQTVGPAGKGMCWPPPSGLMYPWMMMPFPAYLGSHRVVPLLPIPSLKPQRSVAKVKKSEAKTKKVASVSVLGLIFCLFLFGALVPFVVRGTVLDVSVNSSSSRGYDSELLVASLFVPRNEKLVKLDGNLIIHPVSTSKEDKLNSTAANGEMKQWFLEGVAGPMFSSEMCTEVFQFDVSSTSGSIRPASQQPKNNNDTHKPFSSMLVSVLTDPREEGDDGEMAGGTKSLSRVFIVVLVDGVKYVTYSCVLPHLVTT